MKKAVLGGALLATAPVVLAMSFGTAGTPLGSMLLSQAADVPADAQSQHLPQDQNARKSLTQIVQRTGEQLLQGAIGSPQAPDGGNAPQPSFPPSNPQYPPQQAPQPGYPAQQTTPYPQDAYAPQQPTQTYGQQQGQQYGTPQYGPAPGQPYGAVPQQPAQTYGQQQGQQYGTPQYGQAPGQPYGNAPQQPGTAYQTPQASYPSPAQQLPPSYRIGSPQVYPSVNQPQPGNPPSDKAVEGSPYPVYPSAGAPDGGG